MTQYLRVREDGPKDCAAEQDTCCVRAALWTGSLLEVLSVREKPE